MRRICQTKEDILQHTLRQCEELAKVKLKCVGSPYPDTDRYIHDPAKAGKAHKNGKARAGRSINYHSICLCQYYQFVAVVEQHRKEPLQLAPATQEKKTL